MKKLLFILTLLMAGILSADSNVLITVSAESPLLVKCQQNGKLIVYEAQSLNISGGKIFRFEAGSQNPVRVEGDNCDVQPNYLSTPQR